MLLRVRETGLWADLTVELKVRSDGVWWSELRVRRDGSEGVWVLCEWRPSAGEGVVVAMTRCC